MKLKQWYLRNIKAPLSYKRWIKLREESKDEWGEKLCYCGHTHKCDCCNPSKTLFLESVKNGTINLDDKENGWEPLITKN